DITYLRKMSSDPSMLAMIAKNNQKLVYYALDILLGMKDKVGLLDVAVHSDSEKADGAAVQALRRLTWICTSADELAFFFVIYQSAKSKAARDEAKKIIDSEQQI
ncbi:hypothetical protein KJ780_01070, partial [Candidatus Micrarchaeota archaeon]|nr:hypothetical protein [Candidatus Micrarchaeota archaeon]